jgi:predicted TIM-barrel fold metal-dependent hydrolase
MKGVGEIFIRSLTNEIHPERIAKDLEGLMGVVARNDVPIQFPTAWSQFPGGLFYGDPLWVDEVAMRHTWRWISVPTTLHRLRLKVLDDANVTEQERRRILWDNAVKLFKLAKEAGKAQSILKIAAA